MKSSPLGAVAAPYRDHARRAMNLVGRHIDSGSHLAYSFTGDTRLEHWAVIYDNAIRVMAHLCTGDVASARRAVDHLISNRAIRRTGFILRRGRRVAQPGWIVNIVNAAPRGPGHRGIELIMHTGPNAYVGMAAAHLYVETGVSKYLAFARERWELIRALQNEDPRSPNFGGVRMGPLGAPNSVQQHLEWTLSKPTFYEFYNGEHAADFRGFSLLMAQVDPVGRERYQRSAELIARWDKVIWDPKRKLFAIGTTEKGYHDINIGKWVKPGVIPMSPLDTSALKICAYGVEGLEAFGPGTAEDLRRSIEENFMVRVAVDGHDVQGYDFVSHEDRRRLIFYEERGRSGFTKVNVGRGRRPILSDEWSTWVALADLRMAADYSAMGRPSEAAKRLAAYRANALNHGIKTAVRTSEGEIAYPYAHPLPYALNKPVGFGWNTHHQPFALIGACARVLGLCRFDPYMPGGGELSTRIRI